MVQESPFAALLEPGLSSATRGAAARALVAEPATAGAWPVWFGSLYASTPAEALRAARLLRRACERVYGRPGRYLADEASSLLRVGRPQAALLAFRRAAESFDAEGEDVRAAFTRAMAVDAMAHAGDVGGARRTAEQLLLRLRGPVHALTRAVLRGNLANVLRLQGRLGDAAKMSDQVARAFARLDSPAAETSACMNAGVSYLDAGRLDLARARLRKAIVGFEALGQRDRIEEARYNLACVDVRDERLGEGLTVLSEIADTAAAEGRDRRAGLARMDRAHGLLRAGDLDASAREARNAERLLSRAGAVAEAAEACVREAAALRSAGRGNVERALERALNHARKVGRVDLVERVRLLRTEFLVLEGGDSARLAYDLEQSALRTRNVEVAGFARLVRAESALRRHSWTRAARLLAEPPCLLRQYPALRAAWKGAEARLLSAQGDTTSAITMSRRSVRRSELTWGTLGSPWLRATYLMGQAEPALQLVDLLLQRGRTRDRREAATVLGRYASARFSSSAMSVGGAPRSPRILRLEQRISSLQDRLALGGEAGDARGWAPSARPGWLRSLKRAEQELAVLVRQRHMSAKAPSPRRTQLAPRNACVHLWHHEGEVRALVARGRDVSDHGALVTRDAWQRLSSRIEFHARRVHALGSTSAEAALDRGLARLRGWLEPLGSKVPRALSIDPALASMPIEALELGYMRCFAPSRETPSRRVRDRGDSAILLSGARGLPHLRDDGRLLAPYGTVFRGRQATRDVARHSLEVCSVVHLAGHGTSPDGYPALGGVRLHDGWFRPADVPRRVSARVVVLAACEADAQSGPASQALATLPMALLRRGADYVIGSRGVLADSTASRFSREVHRRLGTMCPVDAFYAAFGATIAQEGSRVGVLPLRLFGATP